MKARLFSLGLWLFSVLAWGQEAVRGTVLTEEGIPLEKVTIINIKTGEKATSDHSGNFQLAAKVQEEIRLVREGYDRLSHIIKPVDYAQNLSFKMKKADVLINEVVITKISKEKMKNLQDAIEVPQANWKVREKGKAYTTKDAFGIGLGVGLNIDAIQSLASGEARKRKNLYKYEDFQENVSWIESGIGAGFFTERGVPEERVREFITYAITAKPELPALIKAKNYRKIESVLVSALPVYLNRLKEAQASSSDTMKNK